MNHLKSMYFASLCAGAELTGGYIAAKEIFVRNLNVNLIFADFKAEFLKRADGDVHFKCSDGELITQELNKTLSDGKRVTFPVAVVATVPSKYQDEPVARFTLGLSLKRK